MKITFYFWLFKTIVPVVANILIETGSPKLMQLGQKIKEIYDAMLCLNAATIKEVKREMKRRLKNNV
jgi:hypothetical protein